MLRHYIVLAATIAQSAALSAQTAAPADYRAYRKALLAQGLSPLTPASTDYGPGYVYRLRQTADGRMVPETLCPSIFVTAPREIWQQALGGNKVRDNSFKVALSFLPDFLTKAVSAVFGVEISSSKTTDIQFGGLKAYEVALPNSYNPKTKAVVQREVDPACMATLRSLPVKDNVFANKVFVVIRAVTADAFNFTLDANSTNAVSVSGKAEKIASAEVGWKGSTVAKQAFTLQKASASPRVYIAADIVQIQSALAAPQVSEAYRANFTLQPAAASDLAALSRHE